MTTQKAFSFWVITKLFLDLAMEVYFNLMQKHNLFFLVVKELAL